MLGSSSLLNEISMFETNGYKVGSIAGIDVSISVSYIFIMVLIILLNGGVGGFLFAAAVTLSVLIHELGHAVVCKIYNLRPSILLHGFGGLCFHEPADTDGQDALVVIAGPVIEIIFGVAAFGVIAAVPMPALLTTFMTYFAMVSVIWGAINLFLPLWPLDGGMLFHLILRKFTEASKARDWTLKVSMTIAVPLGIVGIFYGQYFVAFLAFFIVMDNYNHLRSNQALVSRAGKKKTSAWVVELLEDAETALAAEDFREAYRVCHQIRSGNDTVAPKTLNRIWEILAYTSVELGEYDEAEGWLRRAPDTKLAQEARLKLESQNA